MSNSQDWTAPGPEQLADDVWRLPLPLPRDALKAVNAYLLRCGDGLMLVDCGWDQDQDWQELLRQLRVLGLRPEDIRLVFATHVHRDHLGAAGRVRQLSAATVTLGTGDLESARLWASDPDGGRRTTLEFLREYQAGPVADALALAHRQEPDWLSPLPDLWLGGGEMVSTGIRDLEVIATPGHTRGHLCLFDRSSGLMLAGDHILPHITPSIAVEVPTHTTALGDFLRSLALVRHLPARLVLPAHGPVFEDLGGRVDELKEHHRVRLELCLEAVGAGGASALQVAERLPWTRRSRRFQELDPFNQMLAVGETAAHLELLAQRGALGRLVSDLGVHFVPGRPDTASGGQPS